MNFETLRIVWSLAHNICGFILTQGCEEAPWQGGEIRLLNRKVAHVCSQFRAAHSSSPPNICFDQSFPTAALLLLLPTNICLSFSLMLLSSSHQQAALRHKLISKSQLKKSSLSMRSPLSWSLSYSPPDLPLAGCLSLQLLELDSDHGRLVEQPAPS